MRFPGEKLPAQPTASVPTYGPSVPANTNPVALKIVQLSCAVRVQSDVLFITTTD